MCATNRMGKIIAVASAKGGAGKSSLAVSIGAKLAEQGSKVLVMETDAGLRCLDIMLGVSEQVVYDLSDILESRCEPIKAILHCQHTENLHLIVSNAGNHTGMELLDLARLCKGLCQYYDYLIIDTPAGIAPETVRECSFADLVLMVVTPDAITARDAQFFVDRLVEGEHGEIRLLINKVTKQTLKDPLIPDFDWLIDTVGAQLIGIVPYDDELLQAVALGTKLPAKATSSQPLYNIAQRIRGAYLPLTIQ